MNNTKQKKSIKLKTLKPKNKKILLNFLTRTKEGKYATIEKSSIPYSRIDEETQVADDVYYYGLN